MKITHWKRLSHPASKATYSTCSWRSRVFSLLEIEPHPALKRVEAFERFTLPDLSEKKVKRAQIQLRKPVPNLWLTHDGWSGGDGMEEVVRTSFVLSNVQRENVHLCVFLNQVIVGGFLLSKARISSSSTCYCVTKYSVQYIIKPIVHVLPEFLHYNLNNNNNVITYFLMCGKPRLFLEDERSYRSWHFHKKFCLLLAMNGRNTKALGTEIWLIPTSFSLGKLISKSIKRLRLLVLRLNTPFHHCVSYNLVGAEVASNCWQVKPLTSGQFITESYGSRKLITAIFFFFIVPTWGLK